MNSSNKEHFAAQSTNRALHDPETTSAMLYVKEVPILQLLEHSSAFNALTFMTSSV